MGLKSSDVNIDLQVPTGCSPSAMLKEVSTLLLTAIQFEWVYIVSWNTSINIKVIYEHIHCSKNKLWHPNKLKTLFLSITSVLLMISLVWIHQSLYPNNNNQIPPPTSAPKSKLTKEKFRSFKLSCKKIFTTLSQPSKMGNFRGILKNVPLNWYFSASLESYKSLYQPHSLVLLILKLL